MVVKTSLEQRFEIFFIVYEVWLNRRYPIELIMNQKKVSIHTFCLPILKNAERKNIRMELLKVKRSLSQLTFGTLNHALRVELFKLEILDFQHKHLVFTFACYIDASIMLLRAQHFCSLGATSGDLA